jgi:inorganic pyrophosphatase
VLLFHSLFNLFVLTVSDWKIIVIDLSDPIASKLNDINDVEKHMPGRLKEMFEFLRDYKIPDGKKMKRTSKKKKKTNHKGLTSKTFK